MDRRRKRELRELNIRAWDGDKDILAVSGSLDSSLKKNTAFIKRIRTGISSAGLGTFLSEIRSLSLHKYLSEIISATYEGLCKLKAPGEISAGVEITSALHQRFGPGEFTRQLAWLLGRGLSTPDKAQLKTLSQDARDREEKDRLARHRALLRVVTELWLVGVLRSLDDVERPEDVSGKAKDSTSTQSGRNEGVKSKQASGAREDADAEPFPLEVIKDLLGHDRDHTNLPLAVIFVKSFSWDILGAKSATEGARKTVEADGATTERENGEAVANDDPTPDGGNLDPPIIDENLRNRFRNILVRYLEDVKAHVIRDQKSLNNQSRRNAEAYVKSGEIFEDRQANFEKQAKAHEKLVANTQILCDVLGVEMPDLAEKEASDAATASAIGIVKAGEYLRGQGDGPGIWEDEEERRFYENLVDLRGRVPAILLEEAKKKKTDTDDAIPKKPVSATENVQPVAEEEEIKATAPETSLEGQDEQSTTIASKTVGAQVDALLTRLPELQNKDSVDQLAEEFCFLNSKASRNRLVKAVQEIPKGRSDLLPLYSRLIATLGQYMPDVIQSVISYLDDEFRSLQRRKSKDFLGQVRTTNVRYLAELTKFGVVPEHVIFHCFKVSLDDFSRMNIEIIGNLLENCGRFLLRNPETSPRMNSFMETLNRKKTAQHLGAQERMLLDNAMYYVDPPQRAAIQQKERTPIDAFIRQLIYLDMNKRNYTKVLKSIRKLHWEEAEVVRILEKVFSKPGKVKFSNIHLLAILLGALNRYHQDFVVAVIDNVLENVTLGLEQNDFKFNQRRIAEVKYLAELYNYKMLDSAVIFDLLYRVVTFGHENGTPQPGKVSPFDPPDEFFRIRLVCTVLDNCGVYFDRGPSKKKLDFFLTFFQYYLLTKDPLPMDIDFIVQDTLALVRPQWKLVTDLSEAARIFADACAAKYRAQVPDTTNEVLEDEAEEFSEEELGEDGLPDGQEDVESSGDDVDGNQEDDEDAKEQEGSAEEEEEQIFVTRKEEEIDPEEAADFDRAFQSMMTESMDSRKNERRTMFDIPLPMRPVQQAPATQDSDGEEKPEVESPPNTMAFALMTKRGNRQQTRTIELPSDSTFAVAAKTQREAEREEQQRIKNLVLNYDLRDEDNQDGDPNQFPFIEPIDNFRTLQPRPSTKQSSSGLERQHASHARDKSGTNRSSHRARRLQLSDVDWYENRSSSSQFDRVEKDGRKGKSKHNKRTRG